MRADKGDGKSAVIGKAVVSDGIDLFACESEWVTLTGELKDPEDDSYSGKYKTIMRFRQKVDAEA